MVTGSLLVQGSHAAGIEGSLPGSAAVIKPMSCHAVYRSTR